MAIYYNILGIPLKSSKQDISRAYRRLALKYHPDKNLDNQLYAKKKFIEVSDAYVKIMDDLNSKDNNHNNNNSNNNNNNNNNHRDDNNDNYYNKNSDPPESNDNSNKKSKNFFQYVIIDSFKLVFMSFSFGIANVILKVLFESIFELSAGFFEEIYKEMEKNTNSNNNNNNDSDNPFRFFFTNNSSKTS